SIDLISSCRQKRAANRRATDSALCTYFVLSRSRDNSFVLKHSHSFATGRRQGCAMRLMTAHFNSMLVAACAVVSLLTTVFANDAGFQPGWMDSRQIGPFIIQATFNLKPYERLFAELPELQRE